MKYDIIDVKAQLAIEGHTYINKVRTIKYERLLLIKDKKNDKPAN